MSDYEKIMEEQRTVSGETQRTEERLAALEARLVMTEARLASVERELARTELPYPHGVRCGGY